MYDSFETEILGADGLQNQYILLHVKNIDKDTLQRKLKEPPGTPPSQSKRELTASLAGTAVSVLDRLPKATLDLARPFLIKMLRNDYGIDAEIKIAETPFGMKARRWSEFFPGVIAGAVVGALLTSLVYGGKSLLSSK